MKNTKIIAALFFGCAIIVSCGDSKTGEEIAAEIDAKYGGNKQEEEVSKIETRTIDLVDYTLSYNSQYLFSLSTELTADFKTIDGVADAKVYRLGFPDREGMIGLSYQKNKSKTDVEGAINGLLNGYVNSGAVLSNQSITDVSDQYGVSAKLIRGNILYADTKVLGDYISLILADDKYAVQIHALFESSGGTEVEKFIALLESVSLKKK